MPDAAPLPGAPSATRPLLKRKLAVPATWAGAIARPRPMAAVEAALATGRHVALLAGSGFGKTTLAAQIAQTRPTAWVGLDAEDAAPDAFLAYLIAAVERAVPGFVTGAAALAPHARDRAGARAALDALLADMEEQLAGPLVIVLDDMHLAASPGVDAIVERMVGWLPERARLVLAARHDPAWGLEAYRAKRVLEALDEAALAFDAAELTALAPGTDAAARAALLAETGGWPAGMGLTPAAREAYLDEQVLRPLDAELQAFLPRAALLDAFDAPLCEEAFGVAPDEARDERLVRLHLAERVGLGQLALRPPLRGLLRERFHRVVPPAERAAIARTLGEALLARGRTATAIALATDAGAAEWAAEALAGVAEGWLRAGALDALAAALARLGEAAARPDLQVVEGALARRLGDFDRADAAFARARAAAAAAGDAATAARATLGQAMAAAAAGRVAAASALLAEARPGLPDGPEVALDVTNLEGGLALLAGDAEAAALHFEGALRQARRLGDRYAEGRATHNLGVCHTRQGELTRALACYDAALAAGVPGGPTAIAMTPVNRALVLVELGRAAEGRAAAEEALAATRRGHTATEEGYALRTLGFAAMRLGALDDAERCFHEAEQLARRTNDALGLAFSLGFQAELALERGEAAQAARALAEAERALGGKAAADAYDELRHVAAKVAMRAGRAEEAMAWLAELRGRPDVPGYRRMIAEVEALATAPPAASAPARPAPPSELAVACFGGLDVTIAGRRLEERDWQSARARALLVYLLHEPAGVTRMALTEALYGGEEPGESSLYMNFTRLRKALEPDLDKGKPSRWVLRREGTWRFNREGSFALDTEAFKRALAAAKAAPPAAARAAWEAALARYGGDFFPECEMAWAIALRHGFREDALAACRALIPIYEAEAPAEVLPLVRRALAIDPLSEEFNRELILRHLEAGDGALARAHFDLVAKRWREALDAQPPEDIAALFAGRP